MDDAKLFGFEHTAEFDSRWSALGLDDDDLCQLQFTLLADPTVGKVIAGTGGLRKIRFAPTGRGRGKSGAYRVCYYFISPPGVIVMMEIFGEGEKDNLSAAEKNEYRKVASEIQRRIGSKGNQ